MGEIKLVHVYSVFYWQDNLMVSTRFFSPCGVQGKLKFLSFGFILSLRYYFVHAHIEILPVLASEGSSKFVSLI